MTTFVLDTDMMSLLQRGDRGVAAHFDRHQPYDVATTINSVEEQLSGWYALLRRAKTPMDLTRIYGHMSETVRFLGTLPILTFTVGAAGIYERLRSRHPRIGRMDLRIAAVTLSHEATLVTRNLADFKEIEGLVVVDWSRD